jgi:hypothetical protein
MLRPFIALALLLPLLAACRGGDSRRLPDAPPGSGSGDTGGAFVILGDPDTIATERYTRSPGHLSGLLLHSDGTRIQYEATVARDESITRLELRLWHPGAAPDSPPAEHSVTELRGAAADSLLRADRVDEGRARRFRVLVAPGAQPYLLPSVGLAQQLLRRARRLGGDSTQLEVVVLNGAALPQRVGVRWLPGDSAEVRVGGARVRLGLDADGRIRAGSDAALRMSLKRLAPGS